MVGFFYVRSGNDHWSTYWEVKALFKFRFDLMDQTSSCQGGALTTSFPGPDKWSVFKLIYRYSEGALLPGLERKWQDFPVTAVGSRERYKIQRWLKKPHETNNSVSGAVN